MSSKANERDPQDQEYPETVDASHTLQQEKEVTSSQEQSNKAPEIEWFKKKLEELVKQPELIQQKWNQQCDRVVSQFFQGSHTILYVCVDRKQSKTTHNSHEEGFEDGELELEIFNKPSFNKFQLLVFFLGDKDVEITMANVSSKVSYGVMSSPIDSLLNLMKNQFANSLREQQMNWPDSTHENGSQNFIFIYSQ